MYNINDNSNESFRIHDQSCSCKKCQRTAKYNELLARLALASSMVNFEERIYATVSMICADEEINKPLQVTLVSHFDESKHTIDPIAKKYLEKASKTVQSFIPVDTLKDGNCLFHSIVSLVNDCELSAPELRVRTVVELVENKTYYINQCSQFVGSFEEALRRTCNNKQFCELYELVALANVLQCEIQSVYPYIDYRAEMKIMNNVFKPTGPFASNIKKVIIFWTNTQDELEVKARPGCGGIWSPNHFVPLVHGNRNNGLVNVDKVIATPQTPRKTTVKNKKEILIRSPEFSPPPNDRGQNTSRDIPVLFLNDSLSESYSYDAQRKRQKRALESDQERNERLEIDRLHRRISRDSESELQRNERLEIDRLHRRISRDSESEQHRNERLEIDRLHRRISRDSESEQQRNERHQNDRLTKRFAREKQTKEQRDIRLHNDKTQKKVSRNNESDKERMKRLAHQQKRSKENRSTSRLTYRRVASSRHIWSVSSQKQHQTLEKNQQILLSRYVWPSAVPRELKEMCLQDFANDMSMLCLQQSICVLCNSRVLLNTMKECSFEDIVDLEILHEDSTIGNIVSKIKNINDDNDSSSFFFLSDALFYKKGYNSERKTAYICDQCHSALIKNKVPPFSYANGMWIGDIPLVLQQLTIVEEKLISLYRHNSCVIKLQSPFHHHSTAQLALKGNVITFMQNVPNIVKSLPLDVDDLCDILKIIFVGAKIPNRVELRRICGVNREKVHSALIWLKNNNHMYRDIPINEKNVSKLPENDVPDCIWTTLEKVDNVDEGNAERTGFTTDPLSDVTVENHSNITNILPMTTSAVLDVNGTMVSSEDISVQLLHKISNNSTISLNDTIDKDTEDEDDVYLIPRSNAPANDYFNSELLLGLFPTLFPYGCGAPHDKSRPITVSLTKHIRYLLSYEDQRFEKHHSFMFVLFNMMQRQQACLNASLIVSRPYFQDVATNLETLTSKEIEATLVKLSKNKFSPVTNPRINTLLKQIKTVGGNVMGSACSRANLRTQIHALIFNQGLPSIFMTINPADVHSRVALYFAGVDLDLDKIIPSAIPSVFERAQIIAAHPAATARFFNTLITSILKSMIEKGVLGPIKAYFGTVENQGRGSLHLHILLWLDHDLTPAQLKELVPNEEFRNGLLTYLEDIIKQDLSSFDFDSSKTNSLEQESFTDSDLSQSVELISSHDFSEEIVQDPKQFEKDKLELVPSMLPIPNPSASNFALDFKRDVVKLVNSNNVHNHTITCYKYSKKRDGSVCRMRMPRKIENVSYIDVDSGEIGLKRLHETINNFNEYIITACRSNMDIKYIFSGSDAKALVYYITDYVTKSSLSFHDTFSLVLKAVQSLEKHQIHGSHNLSAEEKSRKLILRCYNTLASQQELSGTQVASYLMGWPDHYTTHEFANIYLIGIENYLQTSLIQEQSVQQCEVKSNIDCPDEESCVEVEEQFLIQPNETKTKYVYVNTRVDYQFRSIALDDICLYDYIRLFRKKPMDANDRKYLNSQLTTSTTQSEEPRRGRPLSERKPFLSEHPQASSHINMKRSKPVVPVLLGPPIPRSDRDDTKERYCRSILALFLPWRTVSDLCDVNQTWEQAFETRHGKIISESHRIINNIQLLQECKTDRDEHLQQVIEVAQSEIVNERVCFNRNDDTDSDEENDAIFEILEGIDMDENPILKETGTKSEEIYFERAVQAVDRANRFANNSATRLVPHTTNTTVLNTQSNLDQTHLVHATTELILLNNSWQRKIREEKERRRNASMMVQMENDLVEQNDTDENQHTGAVDNTLSSGFVNDDKSSDLQYIESVTKVTVPVENVRESIADRFTLNQNQKAAYMIITCHLDGLDTLNEDDKQNQLIMCVPGCGGTGKSQLIRAITAYFTETNRTHKLRKLAPTSVAAAEIDGMTVHSFLGCARNRKAKSNLDNRPGQIKLENAWRSVEYIILDEISMVGLSLLGRLNKLVSTAKHADPMTIMGGVNIIFFGDYIQYSPVLDKSLYYEFSATATDNRNVKAKVLTENEIQQKSARALILQINCVVILEQQMRTKDLPYQALLNRVRNGNGTYEDWLLLRTRVIGVGLHISLNEPPWNEAPILVYRNEIRTELNNRAVIHKAYELGKPPTVVIAKDSIKAKKTIDLPDLNKRLLALPDNKTEHLPGYLPLVPGMPVLLQENIACELGLSNGTAGIFRELIYNHTSDIDVSIDKNLFPSDTIFVSDAQYALIEIPKSKMTQLDSLDPLIVPIPVIEKTFSVNIEKLYADKGPMMKLLNSKNLKTSISVKRKGLPLIPAYSITTHKSQGQTLRNIVIDLNMPPGTVEVASAYVPLSRVQQLSDLVVLRDFHISALQVKPSKGQLAELNRLGIIFEQTKKRYAKYFT